MAPSTLTGSTAQMLLTADTGSASNVGLVEVRLAAAGASIAVWLLSLAAARSVAAPVVLARSGVSGAIAELAMALAALSAVCAALAPGVGGATLSCWASLLLAVPACAAAPCASRLLHLSVRLFRANNFCEAIPAGCRWEGCCTRGGALAPEPAPGPEPGPAPRSTDLGPAARTASATSRARCQPRSAGWPGLGSRAGPVLVVSATTLLVAAVGATGGCDGSSSLALGGAGFLQLLFLASVAVAAPAVIASLSLIGSIREDDGLLLRKTLVRSSALFGTGLVSAALAAIVAAVKGLDRDRVVAIAFTALLPYVMLMQVTLLLLPAARTATRQAHKFQSRIVRNLSVVGLVRSNAARSVMMVKLEQFEAFLLTPEGCTALCVSADLLRGMRGARRAEIPFARH
jgi:hypothetical protein